MAACDYVPIFFKNRLHLAGRSQMHLAGRPQNGPDQTGIDQGAASNAPGV
jgi:hypothetical protein